MNKKRKFGIGDPLKNDGFYATFFFPHSPLPTDAT